jgi:very-short-patch-repair endonuclease
MAWKRDTTKGTTARTRATARRLRQSLTDPERRLWWHLRHRLPAERTHFRREVAIGPYIADFCCLAARVIVEVGGEQHGFDSNLIRDEQRTAFLNQRGFRVLRFTNREVMTSIDVVLDTVLAALGTSPPTPTPPRKGEGIAILS